MPETQRQCVDTGCDNDALEGRSLCRTCLGRSTGKCTFPDCGKKHKSRGWCNAHYDQVIRRGEEPYVIGTRPGRKSHIGECSEPNCHNIQHSRGLCRSHYRKDQRKTKKLIAERAQVLPKRAKIVGEADESAKVAVYGVDAPQLLKQVEEQAKLIVDLESEIKILRAAKRPEGLDQLRELAAKAEFYLEALKRYEARFGRLDAADIERNKGVKTAKMAELADMEADIPFDELEHPQDRRKR